MLTSFVYRQAFSSTEFLLTAIPTLLLGMGGYELTRWHHTRHLLNLALVEAARAGSVHHAMPEQIAHHFEQALDPLFASATDPSKQKQRYLQKVENITQLPAWRIILQSPTHEHFLDFHRKDLAIAQQTGLYAIDNNYQKEQHHRKGLGSLSKESIYEANTLSMSLSYAYEPIVPGMKFLFKQLRHFYTEPHTATLLSHGFLPIQYDLSISMQSHPVQWQSTTKVITSHPSTKAITTNHPSHIPTTEVCHGIWCHPHTQSTVSVNRTPLPTPSSPSSSSNTYPSSTPAQGYTPPTEETPSTVENATTVPDHNHPLCGISLCCS